MCIQVQTNVQIWLGTSRIQCLFSVHLRLKAKTALIIFKPDKTLPGNNIVTDTKNGLRIEGAFILYPDFLGELTIMNPGRQVTCLLFSEDCNDDVVGENREKLKERGNIESVGCYRRLGWMQVYTESILLFWGRFSYGHDNRLTRRPESLKVIRISFCSKVNLDGLCLRTRGERPFQGQTYFLWRIIFGRRWDE